MKVLIVSGEVWKDGTNGGNVLSNIFADMGYDISQIYCNPGMPQNNLCRHYYQMTDSMVIKSFLKHKPIGKEFTIDLCESLDDANCREKKTAEMPNKKMYSFFHAHRLGIFYSAKHFLWNHSNWKNEKFNSFLDSLDADLIFAPSYGDKFMLKMTRYIGDRLKKPIISYVSDDSYTLKHFSLSPFFWAKRFSVRRQLRKTVPYYSLVYTMTETQKEQWEKDFGARMKILRKSFPVENIPSKETVNDPIRFVYAGGIYLNRYKTLTKVAKALCEINKNGVRAELHIYTGNEISKKIDRALNDGETSFIHSSVSSKELAEIYKNSDIALHVESFDLKNRLAVRMSFSTKIVDCLASGCAVMAICDKKQGGYVYLKESDAAICIDNPEEIKTQIEKIVNNPGIILEYSEKAKKCCRENHNRKATSLMIRKDFEEVIKEQ